VYVPDAGSVTVCVTVKNDAGCTASTCTTITATPAPTVALSSASATGDQTVAMGANITAASYTTARATTATVSGLPEGVNYAWNNPDIVISGAPTEAGTFAYTVTATGECGTATAQGTITVTFSFSMTTSETGVGFQTTHTGVLYVNWGDGTSDTYTAETEFSEHTYSDSQPHTIVGAAEGITRLDCGEAYGYNQLTALDVSGCHLLTFLDCSYNQLAALDVSTNTALEELYCYGNQLTTLDVSTNTALTLLACFGNQLTTLDVSTNTALTYLNCSINQLGALDVSTNTALTFLYVQTNQLNAAALDALFGTLHSNAVSKSVYIRDNPAGTGAGTSGCTQSIAAGKGWTVNTTSP
jgi:hypothetical protein